MGIWYYIQAVAREQPDSISGQKNSSKKLKKLQKSFEKLLTNAFEYDIVIRLSREWHPNKIRCDRVCKKIFKKLQKSFEKRLTNEIKYDMMDKLSSRAPNEVRWNAD